MAVPGLCRRLHPATTLGLGAQGERKLRQGFPSVAVGCPVHANGGDGGKGGGGREEDASPIGAAWLAVAAA